MNVQTIIKRNEVVATGWYVMEAIEPWMSEKRTRANLLGYVNAERVLLQDLEMAARGSSYFIETSINSFLPDESTTTTCPECSTEVGIDGLCDQCELAAKEKSALYE